GGGGGSPGGGGRKNPLPSIPISYSVPLSALKAYLRPDAKQPGTSLVFPFVTRVRCSTSEPVKIPSTVGNEAVHVSTVTQPSMLAVHLNQTECPAAKLPTSSYCHSRVAPTSEPIVVLGRASGSGVRFAKSSLGGAATAGPG